MGNQGPSIEFKQNIIPAKTQKVGGKQGNQTSKWVQVVKKVPKNSPHQIQISAALTNISQPKDQGTQVVTHPSNEEQADSSTTNVSNKKNSSSEPFPTLSTIEEILESNLVVSPIIILQHSPQ
ncbi:hypothetical protein ACH5RR_032381 [Cinchona calisaya]|uniref:Uncharacterized protein n=1 Tax=Cinchona calisaya TaxID=153742 RepID=A0ABD2YHW5_9GENT